MYKRNFSGAVVIALGMLACSSTPKEDDPQVPDTVPDFPAATFTRPLAINNPYWPLRPGIMKAYFGSTEEGPEIIIVQVLDESRVVQGIPSRVVRDRVFLDGALIEDTHDWFAQDDLGNVWYMGETVDDYNYDDHGELVGVTHDGAWEAGKDIAETGDVALPGYQMLAAPVAGRIYHQEYYLEEAEDAGEILETAKPITLEDGSSYTALVTRDFSTADPLIEGRKYYAAGLGMVLETAPDETDRVEFVGEFDEAQPPADFAAATFTTPAIIDNPYLPWIPGTAQTYEMMTAEGLERVLIEVLDETRLVAGIETVVVRDRVSIDGVLIEDTYDWYAQDDAGNVWYMGEAVDDYIYDEAGELVEITHPGSWEAGLDVASAGAIAHPGINMFADPAPRTSYRQELYPGEAEDMAFVVRRNARVELSEGTVYENCLQILEWVPGEPGVLEYKYYAPGVGLVAATKLGSEETLELRP